MCAPAPPSSSAPPSVTASRHSSRSAVTCSSTMICVWSTSMPEPFDTVELSRAPVVAAPDGSAVRPLCQLAGVASFAHYRLERGEVAKAVSHATVQEIWYVVAGAGQMWRHQGEVESTVDL